MGRTMDRDSGGRAPARGNLPRAAFIVLLQLFLLATLVPFGSTGRFAMPIAMLLMSGWSVIALAWARPASPLALASLVVALALVGLVIVQTTTGLSFAPAHPIWATAAEALGEALPGTVSISPDASRAALPALVVPFLVFAAVHGFLRSDEEALSLLRFLAWSGSAVAFVAIAQYLAFPDTVVLSEKRAYLDSLTAVFVNKNTAATFLGCTLLLLLALIAGDLRGRTLGTLFHLALSRGWTRREARITTQGAALFVVTLALFLTKSRAGVASTGLAVCLLVALLSTGPRRGAPPSRPRTGTLTKAFAVGGALLVALFAVTLLFGGQTLQRAEMRGIDDARFCVLPGMWRAALDAWPWGSGAGTFAQLYPAYRDPECGIYGLWNKAHNFYLEGLVTLGLPFVVLCAFTYPVLLGVLGRGLARRSAFRFAPSAGFAVLLLLTLHDIVDFSLQIPAVAVWSAVTLACCCNIANSTRINR